MYWLKLVRKKVLSFGEDLGEAFVRRNPSPLGSLGGAFLFLIPFSAIAQFASPAGQSGSTAIYKDSSVFVGWAKGCTVVRGYQDIFNPAPGYASVGDSSSALGIAGLNGVVSLGDGGYAILTFESPIKNDTGWDFAVFENSFSDTYLELAFVEVSSDGINYFRFPCTSYTQDTIQVDGFGNINATNIDNLAGKYRALYGTPFDLGQLASQSGLDVNSITHVKIIDVIGSIQNAYASYDQYGNKINDPWNTPFPSGGFDLDAVGVIHTSITGINESNEQVKFNVFPNPVKDAATVQFYLDNNTDAKLIVTDITGEEITVMNDFENSGWQSISMNTTHFPSGIYLVTVITQTGITTKKISVQND